jgi:GAF domain-containing protein
VQIDGFQLVRMGLCSSEQPDQPIQDWFEQRFEQVPAPDDVALDDEVAQRLAKTVRQSNEVLVIEDILSDSAYASWHETAQACGFRAVSALPLMWHEQSLGIMIVAAATADLLDSTTRAMLKHLADTFASDLAVHRGLM